MKNIPEQKLLYLAIITTLSMTSYSASIGNSNALSLGEIDGQNGFKIRGITDARIGTSVNGIGDINGDGIDDLLVGSSTLHDKSYVIFGQNQNLTHPFELSTLDGSNGFVINENVVAQKIGDFNADSRDDVMLNNTLLYGRNSPFLATVDLKSLTPDEGMVIIGGRNYKGVGDFNGDGFDDLSVGSPYEDGTTVKCYGYYNDYYVGFSRGANYIIFGNNEAQDNVSLVTLDPQDGFKILGSEVNLLQTGASFGSSSTGIGDINGDGFDDLTVNARGYYFTTYDGGCESSPQSYVIFGSDQKPFTAVESVNDLNGSNGFRFNNGVNANDYQNQVAAMGDFNGDGVDDFSVCRKNVCNFIFGQENDLFPAQVTLKNIFDGFHGFFTNINPIRRSPIPSNYFLDFNNDGNLDVIKTWRSSSSNLSNKSYVLYGKKTSFFADYDKDNLLSNQGLIIEAASNSITAMDTVGDINNDGITDIIIGLPGSFSYKGQSFVIYGQNDVIFKYGFD